MKNKKSNQVLLPQVLSFRDYHDIKYHINLMNKIFDGQLQAEELGFNSDSKLYDAIFFLDKDKEYDMLVDEWKNSFQTEEKLIPVMRDGIQIGETYDCGVKGCCAHYCDACKDKGCSECDIISDVNDDHNEALIQHTIEWSKSLVEKKE